MAINIYSQSYNFFELRPYNLFLHTQTYSVMMHQYFNKLNNRKASSLFDDLAPDTAVRLVRSDAKQSGHFNDGDLQSDDKETAKAPSVLAVPAKRHILPRR
ncbi:MAG: hypothetical protein R2830_09130 [Saprospiraceae bacterium]